MNYLAFIEKHSNIKDYLDNGGTIQDLPLETRLKLAEETDHSDEYREQREDAERDQMELQESAELERTAEWNL